MASQILSNMAEKAKNMTGEKSQKIADLAADTKDVHDPSYKLTSDYGVKQTNTDDWLGVASENKNGPMLLEDSFGREKVWSHSINL
jgi:catalase